MEPKPETFNTHLGGLLSRLRELSKYLPDDYSTKSDRRYIEIMQKNCWGIQDGWRLSREMAAVFEINLENDFLLAHSDQFTVR
jgi:hypothetical protein